MAPFRRSHVSWRFGVLAGAELDLPDGVRRRGGAVADGEKLPVADGLQGGCIARNAA